MPFIFWPLKNKQICCCHLRFLQLQPHHKIGIALGELISHKLPFLFARGDVDITILIQGTVDYLVPNFRFQNRPVPKVSCSGRPYTAVRKTGLRALGLQPHTSQTLHTPYQLTPGTSPSGQSDHPPQHRLHRCR